MITTKQNCVCGHLKANHYLGLIDRNKDKCDCGMCKCKHYKRAK